MAKNLPPIRNLITNNQGNVATGEDAQINIHKLPAETSRLPREYLYEEDDDGQKKLRLKIEVRKTARPGTILKGEALIINNEFFDQPEKDRRGSSADVKNLETLLNKLKFNVSVQRDLDSSSMLSKTGEYALRMSSLTDADKPDMIIVAFLSHGDNGTISGTDGVHVEEENILKKFSDKSLVGIPKFFIFVHCRGSKKLYDADDSSVTLENTTILHSTIEEYTSKRNAIIGTWLIDCFCNVLMNHAFEMDLFKLLNKVTKELDENSRYRREDTTVNKRVKKTQKQNCIWTTSMDLTSEHYFDCRN